MICSTAVADSGGMQPLLCGGAEPFWNVTVDDARAAFSTPDEPDAIGYDIPLATRAEGRDWPLALTLIGSRETAILVIDRQTCSDTVSDRAYPYSALLLTQRGTDPILLDGCCRPRPSN
ncbi:MAG: hypothetical protein AAF317_03040 [Pseudomonadota bacterium]